MNKRTELFMALIDEIKTHGVQEYEVQSGGAHPHLVFEYNGNKITYPFSATPSSRNTIDVSLSEIRRCMNVKRQVIKSGRPARKRVKSASPMPAAPQLLAKPLPDPFAALIALRASFIGNPSEKSESCGALVSAEKNSVLRLRTPFLGRRERWVRI